MARGGKRQGTPGTAYANRTDLAQNMAPDTTGSAARGGMPLDQVGPPTRTPDDSPMLLNPTSRPGEPITAGLATGPGPGPEALGMDTRPQETQALARKWMPLLQPVIEDADTPDSVKMMFRYLRGA